MTEEIKKNKTNTRNTTVQTTKKKVGASKGVATKKTAAKSATGRTTAKKTVAKNSSAASVTKAPAKKVKSVDKKATAVASKIKPSNTSQTSELKSMKEETKISANTPVNTTPSSVQASSAAPVIVKSGSGVAIISLLLSLGALGLSGYLFYKGLTNKAENDVAAAVGIAEVKKDVDRIDDSISGIETNLGSLKSGFDKFKTSDSQFVTLAALQQTVAENLDKTLVEKITPVVESQKALNANFTKIKSDVEGQDATYALSKSRRLLESAQYQLDHQGDVDGALKLLTLVSTQIQTLNVSSLNTARAKVLAHVNTLQSIETPDLTAISNQLNVLSKGVVNWPLQNEPQAEVIAKVKGEPIDQPKKGFLGEIKAVAKEAFNDSFKVQKIGAKPKVLLAPEERYFLDQNFRLHLLTAQNAMMQGQHAIYINNVSGAREWLVEYFDENDARVSDGVADLAALEKIVLKPALPDISDVISAFDRATQLGSTATENTER